ncbi:hypothetical protein [Frigoriflavimonas asaccharolytica]|uniref:Uncharacterized protein n=1 Tax=Frigoriflavimonas asaccharolytica TaxID=2735899 RepID=A0A8J8KA83_9FLAO|nr:hypothetical protein [Frigoriflavimonas asaccharolytica]NRS91204.1 hypothetical protein [Frigoriflavimonas asaccharolytica]
MKFLLIILIVCSCKEKTFADDIALNFHKSENLTIQKFNEDGNEMGSSLIYYGKIDSIIDVKYYRNMIEPPPPPPEKMENRKDYEKNLLQLNKEKDPSRKLENLYFRTKEIPYLSTKDYIADSITNKNLSIIVKEKDTIPLYKMDYQSNEIKKHKAFPIFFKNISGKTLKIPTEFYRIAVFVDYKNGFHLIRNSEHLVLGCFPPIEFSYFDLKPNEIIVFALPHLKKGLNRKAKIKFYNAESKEFNISIDEKILEKQERSNFGFLE